MTDEIDQLRQQLRQASKLSASEQRKKMLGKTVRQWADGTAQSVCRMLWNDSRTLESLPADVRSTLSEWVEWERAARQSESTQAARREYEQRLAANPGDDDEPGPGFRP